MLGLGGGDECRVRCCSDAHQRTLDILAQEEDAHELARLKEDQVISAEGAWSPGRSYWHLVQFADQFVCRPHPPTTNPGQTTGGSTDRVRIKGKVRQPALGPTTCTRTSATAIGHLCHAENAAWNR